VLSPLPVPLLEGLAEVEDLRETIRLLKTLEAAAELKSLGEEDLRELSS
jgi:hypothetical protein